MVGIAIVEVLAKRAGMSDETVLRAAANSVSVSAVMEGNSDL